MVINNQKCSLFTQIKIITQYDKLNLDLYCKYFVLNNMKVDAHTFPLTIFPAYMGANNPARFAKQFVKDIRMPANLGDISKWFTLNPE